MKYLMIKVTELVSGLIKIKYVRLYMNISRKLIRGYTKY